MRQSLLMVISCVLFSRIAIAGPEPLSPASKQWLEEIVAYIITNVEKQFFINLPSEAERGRFIEQFWKQRDPDPTTEINEFKMQYYKRIALANKFFAYEGRPGWKTERGRIYIMLGPPQEINRNVSDYGQGNSQVGAVNGTLEIWNYFGLANPKLPYNMEFRFVDRLGTGHYVLDSSLDLSQSQSRNFDMSSAYAYFNQMEYVTETAKLHLADTAVQRGIVTTSVSYDILPLAHNVLFFKGDKTTTFVPLLIDVPLTRLNSRIVGTDKYYSLVLSVQVLAGPNQIVLEQNKEINFKRPAAADPKLGSVYPLRTALSLKPGHMQLHVAVIDRFQGKIGQIDKELQVPSYISDQLQISDIVVSGTTAAVGTPALDPRLLDKTSLTAASALNVLFELYHLALDPLKRQCRYQVFYHFSSADKPLRTIALPMQSDLQADCRVNTTLQLTQFPPGFYTLEIDVKDLLSQQQVKKGIDFVIENTKSPKE